MKSTLHLVICSAATINLAVATAHAGAADQTPAPDPNVPTSIELALADLSCGAQTTDAAHFDCVSAAVSSLRSDFGYDLSRLSSAQRNAIDKSCGPRLTVDGAHAYTACVNSELTLLRAKQGAPASTAVPNQAAASPQVAPASVSSQTRSSSTWLIWLVAFVVGGGVVGGGVVMTMRSKPGESHCRSCGTIMTTTAELCPECRRQAADARRQAAAERAERDRALAQSEREPERPAEPPHGRYEAAPQVTQTHEEQLEAAPLAEEVRAQEPETPHDDVVPAQAADAVVAEPVFDPYAVLGITADAAPDAIHAAYEQARARYRADAVEFLGDEVQMYYRTKAEAVERAYEMLTADVVASTPAVDAS
jgi:hypothetical protein